MVVILAGNVFSTFAMTVSSLLIAEGNVRVSMTGMIAGAVVNTVLCTIFIIPMNWGIRGSAIATVLAQMVTVAYFLWYYLSGKTFLKIVPENLRLEWDIVKAILTIGISSFVRTLAGSLSAIVVNRVLMAYGGDMEVSAFGLINRIMMFSIMPGMVVGQGLQPILGFNYGARQYDRIFRAIRIGIIASTAFSIAAFILLYFFPQPIVAIFTSDRQLTQLTVDAAKLVFLAIYVVGFMNIGSIIFQALGKAIPAFITSLARPVLFLIPLVLLLSHFLQTDGVWLAFPITDGLTCILTLVFLVPLTKQLRKMRQSSPILAASPLSGQTARILGTRSD
jgi:Na+-driven multidrug efflux pump